MKGYLQSLPVVGKIFLDVQPEEVWAFWRFMQDHFRTSVINKRSALEMQLVARGLEALARFKAMAEGAMRRSQRPFAQRGAMRLHESEGGVVANGADIAKVIGDALEFRHRRA